MLEDEIMAWPNAGPGRPKGSKNRQPMLRALLDSVIEKDLGGTRQFWAKLGREDPGKLAALRVSMEPKELRAEVEGAMVINVVTGIDRAPNDE